MNFRYLSCLCFFLLFENSLFAVRNIEELGDFYSAVNKDLVIAHFYKLDKEVRKDKVLYEQYKQQTAVFKAAEKMESALLFIKVNLSEKTFKNLELELNIKSYPTFMLFSYGQVIAIANNLKPIDVTAKNVQTFIRNHFSKEITAKLKFIEEERQRAEIERENEPNVYFYTGYGVGPWWRDPYYYPGYWGPSYYGYWHGGHRGGHHRGGHYRGGRRR